MGVVHSQRNSAMTENSLQHQNILAVHHEVTCISAMSTCAF